MLPLLFDHVEEHDDVADTDKVILRGVQGGRVGASEASVLRLSALLSGILDAHWLVGSNSAADSCH